MEISIMSLGNFVEQVAGQKQKVSLVASSTENLKTGLQDDDFKLFKQTQVHFELVDNRIHNSLRGVTRGCRFSDCKMARKNLGVKRIHVKRRYHKARKKKSSKYIPRPDLARALTCYGMFHSSSSRDHLRNRKVERAHFTKRRSIVDIGVKRGPHLFIYGFRSPDTINPLSHNDRMMIEVEKGMMDSNRLAKVAGVSEQRSLYLDLAGEKHGKASHGGGVMRYAWRISLRGGIEERQFMGLSIADRILMTGRVSDFSQVNQIWEPGGIIGTKALGDWFKRFCSSETAPKLMKKVHEIGFHGVCTEDFDQGGVIIVWECGGSLVEQALWDKLNKKLMANEDDIKAEKVPKLTQMDHKISFQGMRVTLELQSSYEWFVGSKREIGANAYFSGFKQLFRYGINTCEGTTEINKLLELCAEGLDTEHVKKCGAPSERILGKRPRDPGRFRKHTQCGVQSEQKENKGVRSKGGVYNKDLLWKRDIESTRKRKMRLDWLTRWEKIVLELTRKLLKMGLQWVVRWESQGLCYYGYKNCIKKLTLLFGSGVVCQGLIEWLDNHFLENPDNVGIGVKFQTKLARYCALEVGLWLHLEDKVVLLGASNSVWSEIVDDTRKTPAMADKSDHMEMNGVSREDRGKRRIPDQIGGSLGSDHKDCLLLNLTHIGVVEWYESLKLGDARPVVSFEDLSNDLLLSWIAYSGHNKDGRRDPFEGVVDYHLEDKVSLLGGGIVMTRILKILGYYWACGYKEKLEAQVSYYLSLFTIYAIVFYTPVFSLVLSL
ncbi:hypothetical protein EUTSA_v10016281mg [Eutrema salsugineum]|uniref:Uncharacterized protein n=1 Tax=Eutrema salsugineum TaxID=72664 RepID=V4NWL0_EUTSA|nr:hypothetical protein EUTSA_v10016281mg [Eutrema salsugineum]